MFKSNRGCGKLYPCGIMVLSMKKWTLARWKKELDKWFSLYIRWKYTKDGYVRCYTCSVSKPPEQIQCGHWIPRNVLSTRFSEENCRPQCVACNMFQNGKPDVFAVNLLQEGVDIVKLQQQRYKIMKVDAIWYENQVNYYKEKVKLLQDST